MSKYPDWEFVVVNEYNTREEAEEDEIFWISFGQRNGWQLLNLAAGGDGGYVVPDSKRKQWVATLSEKRRGKQPALGMKHTEENRKLFSEVSRNYWASQDTYDADEVLAYSFKDANTLYGISNTHYYRLKRARSNDSC